MKLKTLLAVGLLVVLATVGMNLSANKRLENEMRENTVMLLSANKRSGGSGSILHSEKDRSIVLTNRHVCQLFKSGGIVVKQTTKEEHLVVSYKTSKTHDLCLVEVFADLKGELELADSPPSQLDPAIISGHPGLRPISLTAGAFSETEFLDIFVGARPCTEEEKQNMLVCLFFGGMPVLEKYEAMLVTAFIMPGSSGSAVYNASGKLSGVVFAGRGGMSFASIVPYEHVSNFINLESKRLLAQYPSNLVGLAEESDEQKYIKKCDYALDKEVIDVCKVIQRSSIWLQ